MDVLSFIKSTTVWGQNRWRSLVAWTRKCSQRMMAFCKTQTLPGSPVSTHENRPTWEQDEEGCTHSHLESHPGVQGGQISCVICVCTDWGQNPKAHDKIRRYMVSGTRHSCQREVSVATGQHLHRGVPCRTPTSATSSTPSYSLKPLDIC